MTMTHADISVQLLKPVPTAADDPCEFPIAEPPRIMIVEDDAQLAEIIAVMLRRVWFNCSVRRSGAQGIQAFIHDPVDLVITDLRMEAGDGIGLIESIRRTSRVPVIIVTGFAAQYADRVRFLDNVALLNKPFEWAALVDLVEKALDSRSPHGTWNIPPGTFEPAG
jgi:two-component system response regulator CpxR